MSNHDIKLFPLPEIDPAIIDARDNGELAIFIGAGISRLVGCWGWDKLSEDLLKICYKEFEMGSPLLNFKEFETLKGNHDKRKLITIAKKLLSNNGKIDLFFDKIKVALRFEDEKINHPNIYDDLAKFRCLYITTNYDEHFDNKFLEPNIRFNMEEFDYQNIQTDCLYHIHGSIKDPKNMVLTLPEYMRQYSVGENLDRFLQYIFSNYNVLFIGYGMDEFEILEFLFRRKHLKESKKKHFLVKGYFTGEENLFLLDQSYYDDMKINLVPYLKDFKGYNQLKDIVKKWANQINIRSLAISQNLRIIDDAIE